MMKEETVDKITYDKQKEILKIPYIQLFIHLKFETTARPYFLEALIRGALGHHLKKLVCVNKKDICEECFVQKECAYYQAFITEYSGELTFRHIQSVPHPYLLRYHDKGENQGMVEIIIFQKLFRHVHYLIYTLIEMGNKGIGRDNNYYDVTEIIDSARGKNIYQKENFSLINTETQEFDLFSENHEARHIEIEMISPLRLKNRGRFLQHIDFPTVIKYSLIRLTLLSQIYGEFQIHESSARKLISDAQEIEIVGEDLRYRSRERFSSSQGQKLDMGGLIGRVEFRGELTDYMQVIQGASLFGLGKNTTFGCGRIRYQRLE